MLRIFYKLFNHDKIDDATRLLGVYRERCAQLEDEVKEYKGYKLKYEVTRLHVENHEDLELLEDNTKKQHAAYYALHGDFGAAGRATRTQLDERYDDLMRRIGG